MTRISFEEVRLKGIRRWKENGKPRQETRVFMQTINPFNRDADGLPKTREQIERELLAERAEWIANNPGTFSNFTYPAGQP